MAPVNPTSKTEQTFKILISEVTLRLRLRVNVEQLVKFSVVHSLITEYEKRKIHETYTRLHETYEVLRVPLARLKTYLFKQNYSTN